MKMKKIYTSIMEPTSTSRAKNMFSEMEECRLMRRNLDHIWRRIPNHRPFRENAIAIESEAKYPFGGNVYYVTIQITLHIPEFARKEHNLHCDVPYHQMGISPHSGSRDRSDPDVAIKAY